MRNEASYVDRCLASILGQDYPADHMEVLVAEGRSKDETRTLLERAAESHSGVRVLDNAGRIVPTGLNAAVKASRGEVIVRIDGHTTIASDYISRAVEALARTGADVVGGNMTAVGRGWFGRAVAMATSTPLGVGGSRFHYSRREEPAESVYMGVFRRDVFSRFGWFDEGMTRNQDDEFNYRIRAGGGRIVLVPAMRSTYSPRESPWSLLKQYFQYGLYKVRVARLHPSMVRPRHLIPSIFVLALAGFLAAATSNRAAALILAVLAAIYVAGTLWFARHMGRKDPRAWILVPVASLILHLGYGAGFLAGLAASLAGRMPGASRVAGKSAT